MTCKSFPAARDAMARPSPLLRYGAPFVIFCVGGFYGLEAFVSGRVQFMDMHQKKQSRRQFDIEEEHRKIMKKFDPDFDIKRIERPNEEGGP